MKSAILLFAFVFLGASCASKGDHSHHDHSHYKPKFSKLGEGRKVPFSPGHEMIMHIEANDLPDSVTLTEVILAPKSLGAPPHIHKNEDEAFVVLDGTVHFLNGEEEVVGKKGAIASLPRGHWHGFWNPTNRPAKMLLIIAPGHFQKFFMAVEEAVKKAEVKTPQVIGKIITELAARNDCTIDMKRLPPSGLKLLPPPPKM